MPTSLDICNLALVAIGQEPIMSFDDQEKKARLCNQVYEATKQSLLRAYPWTFAIKRVLLAQEQDAPAFEYSHAFRLPTDCMRIVSLGTEGLPYNLEGGRVLTNSSQVRLRYVADVTDANVMDAQFVDCLVNHLANVMVVPLTSDSQLQQVLLEVQKAKISLATNTHAIEDMPMAVIEGDWLTSRI